MRDSDMEEMVKTLEKLRTDLLFGSEDDRALNHNAEQYFLLAITAIEQAQRFATLAMYAQRAALAEYRS